MRFLLMLVVACGLCTQAVAADSSNSTERINLLIVPPANLMGDDTVSHWRFGLAALVGQQLTQCTQVCVVPESSLRFARNELNLLTNREIPADKIRQLGLLTEAQYVVTSDYRRDGERWKVTTQILLVASNWTSKPLSFFASDWFEIASTVTSNIFGETKIPLTQAETGRMARRPTQSAEALELFSQARAANKTDKPLSEVEALLRQSVQVDPQFATLQNQHLRMTGADSAKR